ncbi:class I SAM-dependent methyltransferase [Flagellimonas myxillae]|uniref:class I SAM-dependent methyltransferase n=1 Tax=Flagellimonas myxillae TaxID=2942214 RepID=UPI00201F6C48|nr:class I SAM-dependent methyltransferase [Muricauda myxillae]MCL6266643.1 class I SAM-dependent methyltransferase [Muricauda myxillae]
MEPYLKIKDHSISKEDFELHHDSEIDMLVTFPQPVDLAPYYESEAYISHTDSASSLFDKLYQQIKRRNLRNKLQLIVNQQVNIKSLLDFGAGTGDFLNVVKQKGIGVEGVEPNAKARQNAKKKGVELVSEENQLRENNFDVITLWHVLEHLPNLDERIAKLASLLAADGLMVIAVPNFKSFDAKYYGSYWAAYDVPRHLWHFSRASISKLFAKHGMEVVGTKPMIFDSFYVSLLSEKYKGNRLFFISAFFIGLWSNLQAFFTKEHSSIIYLIRKTK